MQNLKIAINKVIRHPSLSVLLYVVLEEKKNKFAIAKIIFDNRDELHLINQFTKILTSQITDNHSLQLCKITDYDEKENNVYEFDLDKIPHLAQKIKDIDPFAVSHTINFTNEMLDNVKGFCIILGNDKTYIKLYQHKFINNVLKSNNRLFVIKDHEKFSIVNKNMICLESRFDILIVNERIIINNIKMLERNFGFHELISIHAIDGFNKNLVDLVENKEKFEEIINKNIPLARKLLSVISTSPIIKLKIDINIIKDFFRQNSDYGSPKYNNTQSRIIIETMEDVKLFINIVADNYLKSDLTRAKYEALAKNKLTTKD